MRLPNNTEHTTPERKPRSSKGFHAPRNWIGILKRKRKSKEQQCNQENELAALKLASQIIGIASIDSYYDDEFSTEFIPGKGRSEVARSVLTYDFSNNRDDTPYLLSTKRRCILLPLEAEYQIMGVDYSHKEVNLHTWRSLAEQELQLVLDKEKGYSVKQGTHFYESMLNIDIAGAKELISSNIELLIKLQKLILSNPLLSKPQLIPYMEQVNINDRSVTINLKRNTTDGSNS